MEHYVYLYTDPSRSEPIYVGLGKGRRAWAHLKTKKTHPFIQGLGFMKASGVDPVIAFICTNVDRELAGLVEQEVISKYGRKDLGLGPLLNMTDGGDGGLNLIVSEKLGQNSQPQCALLMLSRVSTLADLQR